MLVLIFANGEMRELEWIRPYLAKAVVIIAADGGSRHLAALNVRPDLVVGDMDSLPASVGEDWQTAGTRIITHPAEKDETDLELALLYAVLHYEEPVLVFGAMGGRLDHMMGNLLLLAHPALVGREVKLVEPFQRAWLVDADTRIQGEVGDLVSLIPLNDDVEIGRTMGLKWKLEQEALRFGLARGISNVMTESQASVEVLSGLLLCIHIDRQYFLYDQKL
jgi:thiamine pyrophosphokinase